MKPSPHKLQNKPNHYEQGSTEIVQFFSPVEVPGVEDSGPKPGIQSDLLYMGSQH